MKGWGRGGGGCHFTRSEAPYGVGAGWGCQGISTSIFTLVLMSWHVICFDMIRAKKMPSKV